MLTLGIPGSSTTALMMGALLVLNVVPGPTLFTKHPDIVWGLVASMYVSNFMLLVLNLPLVGLFVRILYVPERILLPLILAIGAFAPRPRRLPAPRRASLFGWGLYAVSYAGFAIADAQLAVVGLFVVYGDLDRQRI